MASRLRNTSEWEATSFQIICRQCAWQWLRRCEYIRFRSTGKLGNIHLRILQRQISHAILNTTPNEIALTANKIAKWTSPGIVGRFLSSRMLKPRTITIGGSVHHFQICTFSLLAVGIRKLPPQGITLNHLRKPEEASRTKSCF
jgi:hypothetical protein